MSPLKLAADAKSRRQLWFERFMAILALADLGLVVFDLSYIRVRDLYYRYVPTLTRLYDPIKGIEPYRDTQQYLEAVEALKAQVNETGLQSPPVEVKLKELGDRSAEMIENNPFALANKTGTLEKIKNRMRGHIGNDSSKQSFRTFWSQPNLSQKGWSNEIAFYDKEIKPLIATNYFRPYGETGDFVDYFLWRIDIWFIIPFGLEFLARTYYISRRHAGLRWVDAMLWRWYDIFLILPFLRWLRAIPVTIRLHQAELLNLEFVREQINQGFVANFAEDLAEVVVLQVLGQVQSSIRRGELSRWLSRREARPYIDINNINEVEAIATLMLNLSVYQVLPKILPDLEALLRHNIEKILKQSPVYQSLHLVPGFADLNHQLAERLAKEVIQGAYNTLTATLEDQDPIGDELTSRLMQHFNEALGSELQAKQTLQKIQSLLLDMLEEIKLNYVQQLSEEDLEQILEQTRAIRRQIVKH